VVLLHIRLAKQKPASGDVTLVQGGKTVRRQVRSGIGEHVDSRVSNGGWTIVFVFFTCVPEGGPAQHEEHVGEVSHASARVLPPCLHLLWNKLLDGAGSWKRQGKGEDKTVGASQVFSVRGRSAAKAVEEAADAAGRGTVNMGDRAGAYHRVSILPNTAYLFPGRYVSHYVDPMSPDQSKRYGCRNTFTIFLDSPRLSEDCADMMWDLMRGASEE
jgi:hypothetical protein